MTDLMNMPAVARGATTLTMDDFLRCVHQRGRLAPLLREAIIEKFLVADAKKAGLTVAKDELQQAADRWRRSKGLHSRAESDAWLAREGLALFDLEDALERDLLIGQLKLHVTEDHLANHFAANRERYDRITLRQILVAREDLARELLVQIREEGAAFVELARKHSVDISHVHGGLMGMIRRGQLEPAVAAAVFAVQPGEIAGPVATPHGFGLFLVENRQTAELDATTTRLIREELFRQWLTERLQETQISMPILEQLATACPEGASWVTE
jgi:hypothetical protein